MSEKDYLYQIQQLVELQKIDDLIFEVESDIENAPRALEELRHRFESLDSRRNHILDKIAHIEEQKRRLSNEIEEDAARLKKSKNKMMQVANDREHQAMVREVDGLERSGRAREEERLTLLEELRSAGESLTEIDGEHGQMKAELDERNAALEETLVQGRDQLNVLGRKRKAASAEIPQPIFQRYEFIRKRLEHPVIVSVENGICSGCNIAVPPQTFIDLQQGQKILNCPNCQRLIFWKEHFDYPTASVKTDQKADAAAPVHAEQNEDTAPEPAGE